MAPEARGTNEASRRAENALTLTRLHPIVSVSPGCFCTYVFFLLLAFFLPPSSALRIRRVMHGSITVTRASRASRPSRASCPRGLPPSCPWLAPWFAGSLFFAALCPSRASSPGLLPFAAFRPFMGSLSFASSLISFHRLACSEIL